jgi:hypothetical protein
MISRTESVQSWLENLTMQMCDMVISFLSLEVLGTHRVTCVADLQGTGTVVCGVWS